MTPKTRTLTALLALGFAGAVSTTAMAQDTTPTPETTPAPQTETPTAQDFDDAKLRSFAVAFLQVREIRQTYQPQLEAAETQEEQQEVQQEAGGQMVEAVENSDGISLDEYNTIISSAQADPELAQKINNHIRDATGE